MGRAVVTESATVPRTAVPVQPNLGSPVGPTIVLGAGMVGVCTALHLQQRGVEVLLLDRRGPGEETSHGNAGVIQQEAVTPYPFPWDWPTLAGALMQRTPAIRWQGLAVVAMLPQLARYAWHSLPARHQRITQAYSQLVRHANAEHQPLIDAAQAQELVTRSGFRFAFRSAQALDAAAQDAERVRQQFGVPFAALDGPCLQQVEPALQRELAGALHWTSPWSVCDPGALVQRYAQLFVKRGGTLVQGNAHSLQAHGGGWRVQASSAGEWSHAEQVVVALGPWSGQLVRPLGYRIPLFVKRGYHQHHVGGGTLNLPLLDAERGYVLAPMRQGLRLTTGAELAALDSPPTPAQLVMAQASANELLELGAPANQPPWLGNRPCMPDMLPVVGPAWRHKGLWFNFGHGHQGFTLGPTTGRLLAEQMAGGTAFIDPQPYWPSRFG